MLPLGKDDVSQRTPLVKHIKFGVGSLGPCGRTQDHCDLGVPGSLGNGVALSPEAEGTVLLEHALVVNREDDVERRFLRPYWGMTVLTDGGKEWGQVLQ